MFAVLAVRAERIALYGFVEFIWRQLGIRSLKQSFKSKHGEASPFKVGSEQQKLSDEDRIKSN